MGYVYILFSHLRNKYDRMSDNGELSSSSLSNQELDRFSN